MDEVEQQALVAGQMIEDRQMETALAKQIGDIAAIQAGQGEKAHQPLLLAGQIAESEQGQLPGPFGAIFTIRRAFH